MEYTQLAARLAASDTAKRTALLKRYAAHADVHLARALKDQYFATNSTNPTASAAAAAALQSLKNSINDSEVHALADWTLGMVALQFEGRIEPAITLIDAAADRLTHIGQPHTAAATQVSKIYALALLGRYDEAIACGERARDVFLAHDDLLAAGKIEQNLGNIYHRRDHYADAAEHYRAAQNHFAAAGDLRLLAHAENGLANILALQHDVQTSEVLYERALARAVATDAQITRAEIECNLGCMLLTQGRYHQALDYLEQSRQRYDGLDMPHQVLLTEIELADAYLEINMVAEAAEIYTRLVPAFSALGMQAEQARALTNHGRACVTLGQTQDARVLLQAAQDCYAAEGNEVGAAVAALITVQIDYREEAYGVVEAAVAEIEPVFVASQAWQPLLLARWLLGDALRLLGRRARARRVLTQAFNDSQERVIPQIEFRCLTSLGLMAASSGDVASAESLFSGAIVLIEQLRAPLPSEEFRTAFITDKLTPYIQMVRLCLDDGARVADALHYVERARAQVLLDLVRDEPVRRELATNLSHKTSQAQVDTTRSELIQAYRAIHGQQSPQTSAAGAPGDTEALVPLLEAQFERLLRQGQQPRPGEINDKQVLDIEALQHDLGTDAALIEYFSIGDELVAFVVTDTGLLVVRHLATEQQVTAALTQFRFQLAAMRHGSRLLQNHSSQLEQRIRHHLHTLHTLLLAKIEPLIGARHLVIAPHRTLYYVPFQALHNGESYLIERREVSYTPSAAIYRHCASLPREPLRRALLVGAPDERTPMLSDEVRTIAPLFPQSTVLVNEKATLAGLRQAAPQADVLHLACHGEFRQDNPLLSALHLSDGLLTVRDAYDLNLHCQLVVLSACDTGVNTVTPGDELLGLVRGFLAAGTPALMVSLWTVEDTATATLMTYFYRRLVAGYQPAAALRAAQRALLKQGQHPFFWSPFVLIGRR